MHVPYTVCFMTKNVIPPARRSFKKFLHVWKGTKLHKYICKKGSKGLERVGSKCATFQRSKNSCCRLSLIWTLAAKIKTTNRDALYCPEPPTHPRHQSPLPPAATSCPVSTDDLTYVDPQLSRGRTAHCSCGYTICLGDHSSTDVGAVDWNINSKKNMSTPRVWRNRASYILDASRRKGFLKTISPCFRECIQYTVH